MRESERETEGGREREKERESERKCYFEKIGFTSQEILCRIF